MNDDLFKPVDLYNPDEPDISPAVSFDPDDSVLNEISESIRSMKEAAAKESELQAKRHKQNIRLTVAILVLTVAGLLWQVRQPLLKLLEWLIQ